MKLRMREWQYRLRQRVHREANFLPKRLVLFTLLLLGLYGVLIIRTEWFLHIGYTGFVEARLRSELTADYRSTDVLSLAPLSLALIEAKVRDDNPYLSEQEIAPLLKTVMAAAYAPIITATPTPGAVAYAVIQSVSFVTESVPTAIVDAGLTPAGRPTTIRSISQAVSPAATVGIQQEMPADTPDAISPQPLPITPLMRDEVTLRIPTAPAAIPYRTEAQATPTPGIMTTKPATDPPVAMTTAINVPTTPIESIQPAPTATPTANPSAGSSAAFSPSPTRTPVATATDPLTATPWPVSTQTATAQAGSTSSPTSVEPTAITIPVTVITLAPATVAPTATRTNTPVPLPTATNTPMPTIATQPTVTPTATPTIGLPPTIDNLSAYVDTDKVYLNWPPIAAAGIVGYNLYRSRTDATGSTVLVNTQPIVGSAYVDTVPTDGSQYLYVVTAVNQLNQESSPSPSVMITTKDQTPPDTPLNFSLRLVGNMVHLQWQASSAPDLAGYNIYRSNQLPVDRSRPPLNGATLLQIPAYQDQIALNGKSYYYVFTAVDLSGNESLPSIEAQIPTVDLEVPAPPTGLTATFDNDAVLLQWQANSESDIVGYRLYRDRTLPVAGTQPLHSEPMITTLSYRDQNLQHGVTYYYSLVALDIHGNVSNPSEPLTVVVPE